MHRTAWILALGVAGCGAVEQSPACAAYVRCVAAWDGARGADTDTVRFQSGGACWDGAEIAQICDDSCVGGLDWVSGQWAEGGEVCR